MRRKTTGILPSQLELYSILFISCLVAVLGNGRAILEHYNLIASSAVLKDQVSSNVTSGLTKLDSFKLTNGVVSFAIWGIVGLICLAVVQSVTRLSREWSYDKAVSSNRFIHPENFSRKNFWQKILLHSAQSFLLLAFFTALLIVYLLYALPISLALLRSVLTHGIAGILSATGGLMLIFACTLVLFVGFKVILGRHQAPVQ